MANIPLVGPLVVHAQHIMRVAAARTTSANVRKASGKLWLERILHVDHQQSAAATLTARRSTDSIGVAALIVHRNVVNAASIKVRIFGKTLRCGNATQMREVKNLNAVMIARAIRHNQGV